ncbi:ABC transporter substrate-binding protein, partial [Reyranella sp.]|uniref:ABC transporter substrate-binding protein n=1 Tax=Reyranella sp. TaxID=1929291 RepID=UPI002731A062
MRITRKLATLAAGLGLVVAAPAAMAETTLRMVAHSDLKVLDPIWTTAFISRNHGYLIYDVLFAKDAEQRIQPQMVGKYETSADKLTWTFTLRDGLEWHDGQPVTAEDCVASLRRWGSRDPVGLKLMANVKDLSAPDARTIRLELARPYGLVIDSLAKPAGIVPFMMPKRVAEAPATQQIKDPTGSGPFMFKADEWRPGDRVVYVKNPNYVPRTEPPANFAGGKVAKVDRVEWVSIADPQTAVNALLNGEVDALESVAHDLLPLVEKQRGIEVQRGAYASQYALRPNWLHPPFNDPRMRLALGYAIDQKGFLDAAVGDPKFWRLCKTYYGCGTPLASDKGTQGLLEGNVEKAKAL